MQNESDFLYRYYLQQAGSGMGTIYSGPIYQTGHGVGSFLAKIYRSVLPYIKKGAKKLGKEFLRTGANVVQDMTEENLPFKESLKKRSKEALNRITSGSGYKHNHTSIPLHSQIKRLKRSTSLKTIQEARQKHRKRNKNIKKNSKKISERDIFN